MNKKAHASYTATTGINKTTIKRLIELLHVIGSSKFEKY